MQTPKELLQQQQKEFEENVDYLRRDYGTEEVYPFGYKTKRGDELFCVPDWGNIKKFLADSHSSLLSLLEEWAKEKKIKIVPTEYSPMRSGYNQALYDLLEFMKS